VISADLLAETGENLSAARQGQAQANVRAPQGFLARNPKGE
jgi:hypothetical protein